MHAAFDHHEVEKLIEDHLYFLLTYMGVTPSAETFLDPLWEEQM
jgi:hypothetical protein